MQNTEGVVFALRCSFHVRETLKVSLTSYQRHTIIHCQLSIVHYQLIFTASPSFKS